MAGLCLVFLSGIYPDIRKPLCMSVRKNTNILNLKHVVNSKTRTHKKRGIQIANSGGVLTDQSDLPFFSLLALGMLQKTTLWSMNFQMYLIMLSKLFSKGVVGKRVRRRGN